MSNEANAIRRQYIEQGKPLAGEWESLKYTAARGHVTPDQVATQRTSFYMGAYSLMRMLKASQDPYHTAKLVDAEIDDFLKSL